MFLRYLSDLGSLIGSLIFFFLFFFLASEIPD